MHRVLSYTFAPHALFQSWNRFWAKLWSQSDFQTLTAAGASLGLENKTHVINEVCHIMVPVHGCVMDILNTSSVVRGAYMHALCFTTAALN